MPVEVASPMVPVKEFTEVVVFQREALLIVPVRLSMVVVVLKRLRPVTVPCKPFMLFTRAKEDVGIQANPLGAVELDTRTLPLFPAAREP